MVSNPSLQPQFRDFWSDMLPQVTITATAQDIALNLVVVADLPAGIDIIRVVAIIKIRNIENTNATLNRIDASVETPAVQVDLVDAINLINDQWEVAPTSVDAGDTIVGDIDISGTVTGNATYAFQLDQIEADLANLLLRDVQTGLRIYFDA